MEKGDLLPNDAPFGGLEAYWRGVTCTKFASTYYLLNAWLEKGDMLPNYDLWCGLEAYQRECVSEHDKLCLLKT